MKPSLSHPRPPSASGQIRCGRIPRLDRDSRFAREGGAERDRVCHRSVRGSPARLQPARPRCPRPSPIAHHRPSVCVDPPPREHSETESGRLAARADDESMAEVIVNRPVALASLGASPPAQPGAPRGSRASRSSCVRSRGTPPEPHATWHGCNPSSRQRLRPDDILQRFMQLNSPFCRSYWVECLIRTAAKIAIEGFVPRPSRLNLGLNTNDQRPTTNEQ